MSYTVDLIVARLPSVDEDAWQEIEKIRSRHHDSPEAPAPALVELHALLIARYPCLSSFAPGDAGFSECVWADGPLIRNFKQEMGQLAISTAHMDSVMPFVEAEAKALGITVVDWLNEGLWRPSDLTYSMIDARVRALAQSAAIDVANLLPFFVTSAHLQACGMPPTNDFYKWFVDTFPEGASLEKVCVVLREKAWDYTELWFFNKMMERVGAPERVARLLEFVGATEAGMTHRLEAAKCITEDDGAPAISTESGEAAATRGYFSPALTTRPDAHATTLCEDAHAVTLERRAHAVSKDKYSNAVTFGSRSFAITRGDKATALTFGASAPAVTTGDYSEAITTSFGSNAVTIRDKSPAVTLGGDAHASTLGATSDAVALGNESLAESMGEGGIAVAVGLAGQARAAVGGAIVLALRDSKGKLLGIRAAMVGQEGIEANTWYQLNPNGEFMKMPALS